MCTTTRASAMNQKAFRIDFAKSMHKLGLQSAQRQTMDFGTQLKNNKDTQFLLLPQCMFENTQMVTGLYGRTREQHSNNQTTCNTHVSCEKCKLNPCLKGTKIVPKISFQLTVDIGKNVIKLFAIIFITSA